MLVPRAAAVPRSTESRPLVRNAIGAAPSREIVAAQGKAGEQYCGANVPTVGADCDLHKGGPVGSTAVPMQCPCPWGGTPGAHYWAAIHVGRPVDRLGAKEGRWISLTGQTLSPPTVRVEPTSLLR